MIIEIDRKRPEPVFVQIVKQVVQLADRGVLEEGFRMPPTRQFAGQLGVNRSTVVRAYEELWAMGYLESSPGSYTRIRRRKELAGKNHPAPAGEGLPGPVVSGDTLGELDRYTHLSSADAGDCICFSRLEPDPRLIDKRLFSSCCREVINDDPFRVFGYAEPGGYLPLRRSISRHMQLHRINAGADEVLITNGSQHSLQLIFQTYLKEGDGVVVESPTYSLLIPLLRYHGVRVFEVPVEEDGMDMGMLSNILGRQEIKLVYSMPTFHNPTGVTMSQQKREELLHLCEEAGCLLLEDSIEEEMKFLGKAHLPVKSMDTKGVVIYLGSFSKVLSPGLRIGWIIAHSSHIARLTAIKTITDISSNTLSQGILYRFLESGGYELHIRRMMRMFRKRLPLAIKAIKALVPPERIRWQEPIGGFLLWLELPDCDKNTDLEGHFRKYGVLVGDGASYFYSAVERTYIRISISRCNQSEIEEGIRRLGEALRALPGR